MEIHFNKEDRWFFLFCIVVAIIGEMSFFHGEIGISYSLFLFAFYSLFFWRFRSTKFTHIRIGFLLLVCIWILGLSYFYQSNVLFSITNLFMIPLLIAAQLTLITNSHNVDWSRDNLIKQMRDKLAGCFDYIISFISLLSRKLIKSGSDKHIELVKKIGLGFIIGLPFLIIIIPLLISADSHFLEVVQRIPNWLLSKNMGETIGRLIVVLLLTLLFFAFLNVLTIKRDDSSPKTVDVSGENKIDPTVITTILVMLNIVYLVFTIIQFKYFFMKPADLNMTYASNARQGFAQLMVVTLINWSVLLGTMKYTSPYSNFAKRLIQVFLSLLIVFSGVMLASAFMRLYMYEDAYGFTILRVLAHTAMLYLSVIFMYTLVKIWIERIALRHFYFLTALLFYTGLHIIQLDQLIVDKNIERYHETGKIDYTYFNQLSYTGVSGLIDLYEKDPQSGELRAILLNQYKQMKEQDYSWQSYNISRIEVYERLKNLTLIQK